MPRFTAPTNSVAHERVEDEVIAINLTTGTYFSLREAASDTWTLLIEGADVEGAAAALAQAHGLDQITVEADVGAFVELLLEAGLLVVDATAAGLSVTLETPSATYRAPVLERYDDMEELLLLD